MTSQKSDGADTRAQRNSYKREWAKTKGKESRRKSRKKWADSPSAKERRPAYNAQHRGWLLTEDGQRARRRSRGQPEPTRPIPHRCECCGISDLVIKKVLMLDHCHRTDKFRGWLCDNCNLGIGRLGDDLEGVRKAVAYLEKHG